VCARARERERCVRVYRAKVEGLELIRQALAAKGRRALPAPENEAASLARCTPAQVAPMLRAAAAADPFTDLKLLLLAVCFEAGFVEGAVAARGRGLAVLERDGVLSWRICHARVTYSTPSDWPEGGM
jgi:hypothetical protein